MASIHIDNALASSAPVRSGVFASSNRPARTNANPSWTCTVMRHGESRVASSSKARRAAASMAPTSPPGKAAPIRAAVASMELAPSGRGLTSGAAIADESARSPSA